MSELDQDCLFCPVCYKVVYDALETSCCRKQFCSGCLIGLARCPLCRSEFTDECRPQPNLEIRERLSRTVTPCHWCQQPFATSEVDDHEAQCPHELLACRYCQSVMRRVEHYDHCATACCKRPVMCATCHTYVPMDLVAKHERFECPKSPQCCPLCAAKVPRHQLRAHYARACKEYPITCLLEPRGCCVMVKRRDMLDHLRDHSLNDLYTTARELQLADDDSTVCKSRVASAALILEAIGNRGSFLPLGNLAYLCCTGGEDFPVDLKRAFDLWTIGVNDFDYNLAYYSLAYMYQHGLGCDRNPSLAKSLYAIANERDPNLKPPANFSKATPPPKATAEATGAESENGGVKGGVGAEKGGGAECECDYEVHKEWKLRMTMTSVTPDKYAKKFDDMEREWRRKQTNQSPPSPATDDSGSQSVRRALDFTAVNTATAVTSVATSKVGDGGEDEVGECKSAAEESDRRPTSTTIQSISNNLKPILEN